MVLEIAALVGCGAMPTATPTAPATVAALDLMNRRRVNPDSCVIFVSSSGLDSSLTAIFIYAQGD